MADSGSVAKLYLSAMRGSDWRKIWEALRELGAEVPDFEDMDSERQRPALASEQRITTTVDIRPVLGRKRDALFAHGSQISESWFSKIPPDIAELTFGREHFIRVGDTTGAPLPEDDLFAGLRPVSEPRGARALAERRGRAGLVERSAAAYASAVPTAPEDDGFFGPASVTWRVSADLSAPVAGLRSLLLQALHPLAMAGVDQHSDWRTDPVGRLAATSAYEVTVTFGDRESARRVAQRVRAIHTHVRGVDTVTGQPYAAGDPALLLWVHAALVDSGLAASALFGTPLTDADADAYVAEMTVAAELLGVPPEMIPDSVAALERYIAGVRPELRRTPAAAESMGYLLDPPGLDEDIAELWQDIRDAAVTALPAWARQMYGYPEPPPLTAARRTEIRQALGVLDAVFLGEPGVLEARQRLAVRMRSAGKA